MYLQITTKCNMHCAHCCYSCTMRGRHAKWETLVDSIAFARGYTESISIGGGEPTLHPRFFDVLKMCLENFDYVWLATNGSQTASMYRLANIINGEDYPDCECSEEDIDNGLCECWNDTIYQEDKLSVALSQDCFHDPIDNRIVELWTKKANVHKHSHFEIRNVSQSMSGIIAQGRAIETGSGWNTDDCACSDIIIKPSGKLRLCGCSNAPVIGDVWSGITEKWERVLESDGFRDYEGYNQWRKAK
jgi:organic radical activating enzyme